MGNEELLAALSDRNRRRIIALLDEKERTVGELVAALRLRQPLVSHHLKVLREIGLVDSRKEGRHRIYRVASATVSRRLRALEQAADAVLQAAAPPAASAGRRH
jgi:DNA-binding transcriptional ArsR family regulator